MSNWKAVNVVPWNSHELEPHTAHVRIEVNFDRVATKMPHTYTDKHGTNRNGTLIHLNNGASYILDNTPDQYPGA